MQYLINNITYIHEDINIFFEKIFVKKHVVTSSTYRFNLNDGRNYQKNIFMNQTLYIYLYIIT